MFTAEVTYRIVVHPGMGKKDERLDFSSLSSGGDSWTRTNDPIDVNDVLYRLSHATTHRFEVPTKVSYQLSHAIVYINYDGYATYSMTFKPKAKSG